MDAGFRCENYLKQRSGDVLHTHLRPVLSEPSERLLSEFALRHGIVCIAFVCDRHEFLKNSKSFYGWNSTVAYSVVLYVHLQDELYRKAVLLETLLSNCDLDLECMQKIVFAVDEVWYSLPHTMTNAILVHQQARRHYSHHCVVYFDLILIFFAACFSVVRPIFTCNL